MFSACIIADSIKSLKNSSNRISQCCNTLVILLGVFTESWFNYIQYLFAESKNDVEKRNKVMCWKKYEIFENFIELPDEQWENRLFNVYVKGEAHNNNLYKDNSAELNKKYGKRLDTKISLKKRKSYSEHASDKYSGELSAHWDKMWGKDLQDKYLFELKNEWEENFTKLEKKINEIKIMRDICAHSHGWLFKEDDERNVVSVCLLNEKYGCEKYGNSNYRGSIDKNTNKTKILNLNIIPGQITVNDIIIIMDTLFDLRKLMFEYAMNIRYWKSNYGFFEFEELYCKLKNLQES